MKRRLFPHQEEAVEFIKQRRFTLLADEMGLGKTLSALATTSPQERTLVIAPKSLLYNWKNEIYQTHHIPNVQIVEAKIPPKIQYNGYILINYDILDRYIDSLIQWQPDTIIVDESHYIKNIKTRRTKMVLELANHTNARIICLTGTPLLSRVADLFPYFVLAGKLSPKDYLKYLNFFSHKEQKIIHHRAITQYTGIKNKDKLIAWLKEFTLRRKKKDIIDLPDMLETIHFLSHYKDYPEDISLKDIVKSVALASHVSHVRHTTALKKANDPLLYDLIDDMMEQTEKLVIFAHHKDVILTLADRLKQYNPQIILGSDSADNRNYAIKKFQEDPNTHILIISILAGGVGLNITNTSYAIFVEMDWTYGIMEQAKARLHRIGQKNTTHFYYVVYESSIDHLVAKAIVEKEQLTITLNEGIEA